MPTLEVEDTVGGSTPIGNTLIILGVVYELDGIISSHLNQYGTLCQHDERLEPASCNTEQHPATKHECSSTRKTQRTDDRSAHPWHKEQSNEGINKLNEVIEHSSVHFRKRNGTNQPDQNTRHDLDMVIKELKKIRKDQ